MLYADAIPNRSGFPLTALRDVSDRVWARLRTTLAAGVQAWIARRAERHPWRCPIIC